MKEIEFIDGISLCLYPEDYNKVKLVNKKIQSIELKRGSYNNVSETIVRFDGGGGFSVPYNALLTKSGYLRESDVPIRTGMIKSDDKNYFNLESGQVVRPPELEYDLDLLSYEINNSINKFINKHKETPDIDISYSKHYEQGVFEPVAIIPNVKASIVKEISSGTCFSVPKDAEYVMGGTPAEPPIKAIYEDGIVVGLEYLSNGKVIGYSNKDGFHFVNKKSND